MNLLAHFYLSRATAPLMVGSFLGDFVKGKKYQTFEPAIAEGILLHREIDYFTDFHPVFLQSKHRLVDQHHHFAGVIVDIFYDHFLAKNWHSYSDIPLETFTQKIYRTLHEQQTILPQKAQQVLRYMREHDWLRNYAELEGIARTLRGMEKRSRYPNQMGSATENLLQHYERFEQEFSEFFEQVRVHTREWLTE
ncbi:MAG: acyl carrier protein phosphodiesterase [Tunicatimonas sp.]|uniref:acyl carrier protein phosphodiesterase n=1 Tax=Tunicatimonas sp. TaxID=1940096 RepID=UPI003C749528